MVCDKDQLSLELNHAAPKGRISCAAALAVARHCECPTSEVGQMLDTLKIRIELCQLGLFGYGPGKQKKIQIPDVIPSDVAAWIDEVSRKKGHVTCAEIFDMAKKEHLSKALIAGACEKMEVKIRQCQIGAFA
ncbi:MAG: hypothetical protein MI742_12815 [Desulfobacterales bacterium]|nr:hypothetical protein [Desulfobacterales bacterium]